MVDAMDSDLHRATYGTNLSSESIKVIAESIGIPNLPDDAAKELAGNVSHKLKEIILDAEKFMHHGKRDKLLPSDIDAALKVKEMEPHYGSRSQEQLPFRFASDGRHELHFIEEKEIPLNNLLTNLKPKAPLDVKLRSHWLYLNGVQPAIPENPIPLTNDNVQEIIID